MLGHLTKCSRAINEFKFLDYKRRATLRLYCVNNSDNKDKYNKTQEIKMQKKARRKEIRTRLIQDFKQTRQRVEEIIERENIYTIPNLLCIGRILATPCLGYLIVSQDYHVT